MPTPVSATSSSTCSPTRTRSEIAPSNVNLVAFESRLSRIFSTMSASASIMVPSLGDVELELQPGALDGRGERCGRIAREPADVDGREHRDDPPGLEPREVEQGVDEPEQPQRPALGDLDPLALGLRVGSRVGQRVRERAEHQRQRRAELVRDVGEELRLGAVELRQLVGARLHGGQPLGARQRGGELAGDHAEEAAVVLVEMEVRARPEHERGGGPLRAGPGDGQHDGAPVLGHLLARGRRGGLGVPFVAGARWRRRSAGRPRRTCTRAANGTSSGKRASAASAARGTSGAVRVSARPSPSAASASRRRVPITRRLVSCTAVKTPSISPPSPRIGLNE